LAEGHVTCVVDHRVAAVAASTGGDFYVVHSTIWIGEMAEKIVLCLLLPVQTIGKMSNSPAMTSNRAVILECLGGLELSHSPSEGEPFGNLYDFLHTIPRLEDADFTSFTDLKSDQIWTRSAKEFGYTFSKRDDRKIFWKTMRSENAFYAELNGYRLVSPFFRKD
jgi:hypothetical protein